MESQQPDFPTVHAAIHFTLVTLALNLLCWAALGPNRPTNPWLNCKILTMATIIILIMISQLMHRVKYTTLLESFQPTQRSHHLLQANNLLSHVSNPLICLSLILKAMSTLSFDFLKTLCLEAQTRIGLLPSSTAWTLLVMTRLCRSCQKLVEI